MGEGERHHHLACMSKTAALKLGLAMVSGPYAQNAF